MYTSFLRLKMLVDGLMERGHGICLRGSLGSFGSNNLYKKCGLLLVDKDLNLELKTDGNGDQILGKYL